MEPAVYASTPAPIVIITGNFSTKRMNSVLPQTMIGTLTIKPMITRSKLPWLRLPRDDIVKAHDCVGDNDGSDSGPELRLRFDVMLLFIHEQFIRDPYQQYASDEQEERQLQEPNNGQRSGDPYDNGAYGSPNDRFLLMFFR